MTKSKSKVVGVICMGGLAAAGYWYYKNRLNKRHNDVNNDIEPQTINTLNNMNDVDKVADVVVDKVADDVVDKVAEQQSPINEEKTRVVPTMEDTQKTFDEEQKQKVHDEKTKLVDMLHKYSMCLDQQNNNSSNRDNHQPNQQGENDHPAMLMAEILNASQQQE